MSVTSSSFTVRQRGRIITQRKTYRSKKQRKAPLRPWLRIKRFWRRKKTKTALAGAGLVILALLLINNTMTSRTNPAAYSPLLDTIAKGESNGNYNAYFGNVTNTATRFTDMTVAEVLLWQATYVQQGSPSSAVGKYQIVRGTLAGLVEQLKIDPQTRFDAALQDRLAIALLERRGSEAYLAHELSREAFAANLAKEWAALPRIDGANPHESYYASDGLNKVQISIDEVYQSLAMLHRGN